MRKISLIFLVISSMASSQLRVGLDIKREVDIALLSLFGGGLPSPGGTGFNLGYEKTLLGLVGAGVEYAHSTDSGPIFKQEEGEELKTFMPSLLSGYAMAKFPLGLPMLRGVVRYGMTLPLEEGMKTGSMWSIGIRVKPPLLPLGGELTYSKHDLKVDSGGGDEMLGDALSATGVRTNIAIIYTF